MALLLTITSHHTKQFRRHCLDKTIMHGHYLQYPPPPPNSANFITGCGCWVIDTNKQSSFCKHDPTILWILKQDSDIRLTVRCTSTQAYLTVRETRDESRTYDSNMLLAVWSQGCRQCWTDADGCHLLEGQQKKKTSQLSRWCIKLNSLDDNMSTQCTKKGIIELQTHEQACATCFTCMLKLAER